MKYDIDFILDEITTMLRTNLSLFLLNDEYLINLKKYCQKEHNLSFTPYLDLLYFTEEALADLINVDFLYDFRDID